MPINLKQKIFADNRAGLVRAFKQEPLDHALCASFLCLWLSSSQMLSKLNCEFAGKYAAELRKATPPDDVKKCVSMDRVDALLAKAMDNLRKRTEKERLAYENQPKRPRGRPRKNTIWSKSNESKIRKTDLPKPVTEIPADPSSIWKRANEERKQL